MARLLENKSLPPGFRFHPTDEELLMFYLKRKVMGKSLRPQMIAEVDVYRLAPWDLPSKACLKAKDLIWYFFCPRSKKYAKGARTHRSTEHGYWKSTGTDRTVQYNNRPVGKIKTLIFHLGKAPHGDRTDWVMHEYRLEDRVLAEGGVPQDAFAICKVYKKSGAGPKNGEHYGAPFVEEEWESDDDDNMETDIVLHPEGCGVSLGEIPNASDVTSALHFSSVDAAPTPSMEQHITSDVASQNVAAASTLSTAAQLHPIETAPPTSPDVAASLTLSTEQQTIGAPATQNVAASTTLSMAAQLPPMEIAPPALTEMEEDEFDRLLAMFTEDESLVDMTKEMPQNEFYNDLEDRVDWSQFCDGFLELNDLQ